MEKEILENEKKASKRDLEKGLEKANRMVKPTGKAILAEAKGAMAKASGEMEEKARSSI